MRISFLIKGKEAADFVSGIKIPDTATRLIIPYSKSDFELSTVTIELSGNSFEAADKLAEVRDLILGTCKSRLLLQDDPSKKYELQLYDQLCDFERGLREVITIGICGAEDDIANSLVTSLESTDFGKLFEMLFASESFNQDLKSIVAKKDHLLEKQEVVASIEKLDEKCKWEEIFGDDEMCTVRKEHNRIRHIRNDVMHSHRMSRKDYKDASALIKSANDEINSSITSRIHSKAELNNEMSLEGIRQVLESVSNLVQHQNLDILLEAFNTYQKNVATILESALSSASYPSTQADALRRAMTSINTLPSSYPNKGDDLDETSQPSANYESDKTNMADEIQTADLNL